MKGTKQEQEGSTEEDHYPFPSLFLEEGLDPDKKLKKLMIYDNTSNSPIYNYQDSYLNTNNTGNLENCKLQIANA
uniref:Uncharacterized protein n=1 Tax=Solanum lycopersicum TaxID=4081 RepID=A0A3Q7EC33_SOLLC